LERPKATWGAGAQAEAPAKSATIATRETFELLYARKNTKAKASVMYLVHSKNKVFSKKSGKRTLSDTMKVRKKALAY